jgi:hypothetical protein
MPFPESPGPREIRQVCEHLEELRESVVFVGGAVVPLLATDSALPVFRETQDVDLVVEAVSRLTYHRIEGRLRELGFAHDMPPGAPVCRWIVAGVRADVMPDDREVVGFGNPWYPFVLSSSWTFRFGSDLPARIVSAPAFLATKWAAFQDRGGGTDFYGSHDLEDILTVLDTRAEAVGEVEAAPADVRSALGTAFRGLIGDGRFLDALPGIVERGRDEVVLARLASLAAVS